MKLEISEIKTYERNTQTKAIHCGLKGSYCMSYSSVSEVLGRGAITYWVPYPTQGLTSLPHKLQAKKGGESAEKGDSVSWVFLGPLTSTGPHGALGLGQG